MIMFPELDPNAFSIGPFSVKWYGVCYLAAFLLCYWLAIVKKPSNWNKEQIEDLLFYIAMGVIFGGRIGYIFLYYPTEIIENPLNILKFWLPGRSFHGGLIGVLIAIIFYARKYKQSFFTVTDFMAPIIPIGIMCGRLGNFINGELFGRITDVPWAMIFEHIDEQPRHPSQLYELFLEGVLLFLVLKKFDKQGEAALGHNSAIFLIFYSLFRIIVENYREPDIDLGFIMHTLTMGQVLSIPMLLVGLFLYTKSNGSNKKHTICNNI